MATKIKGLVSKNKRRFIGDGFDLDLSCIFFARLRLYCRICLLALLGCTRFKISNCCRCWFCTCCDV